jgi:hypothetical protein
LCTRGAAVLFDNCYGTAQTNHSLLYTSPALSAQPLSTCVPSALHIGLA